MSDKHKESIELIKQCMKQAEEMVNNGQYTKALSHLDEAYTIDYEVAGSLRVHSMRAKILYAEKMVENNKHRAIKSLIKQYTKQTGEMISNGQYTQALYVINNAINLDPESSATARAYCIRAKIWNIQGKIEEVKLDIKKAIELNPFYNESYHFLAEIRSKMLFDKGCFDEADYDKILELCHGSDGDDDCIFFYKIGDMFNEKNNNEKAADCYIMAIEEVKKNPNTKGLPEWFYKINPQLQRKVIEAKKGGNCYVRFIPPPNNQENNKNEIIPTKLEKIMNEDKNGLIVFGHFSGECIYDVKTGELVWELIRH